ncbi:hypothetical protein CHISP_1775 [Chitinispirillum alkaliphilum]|nr:hypothetical protein CHISP_1775 [Chitinispirillum alkaliphilum]
MSGGGARGKRGRKNPGQETPGVMDVTLSGYGKRHLWLKNQEIIVERAEKKSFSPFFCF